MQSPVLHELCGEDILPIVMCAIPVSQGQVENLQEYRATCKAFQIAVDYSMRNHKWRNGSKEAADFCGDVLLLGEVVPPYSFNRGIERLLHSGDWGALVRGMRDVNFHEPTQEFIITRLVQFLTHNTGAATAASLHGMQVAVAWAMRIHSSNSQIQLDGCRVLRLTSHEVNGDTGMTQYILGTLSRIMHNNLESREIQYICIDEMEHSFSQMDGDASWVIEMFAQMQKEVYDIPTLVINAMRHHVQDHNLLSNGCDLLMILMEFTNSPTHKVTTHEAEKLVLACMHQYSDIDTPNADDAQESCYYAYTRLVESDFENLRCIRSAMQCTINTAFAFRQGFLDRMANLFDNIMDNLQIYPKRKMEMQNFAANSGMVQLFLSQFLTATPASEDEDTCFAFRMLLNICQENAYTTTLMKATDVVKTIDRACSLNVKTQGWHQPRDRLLAIFASSEVAPEI